MKNSKKSFDELGLSAHVLTAVNTKGFEEPTAIQAMTIPEMLGDKSNIIAQAQTGTGKTAAFGLPLIDMIDTDATTVQSLVLVPTRELAVQVAEEIHSLRGKKNIRIVPIYGGQSIEQQFRKLKSGIHIVVGTPGRIIDHLNRKTLALRSLSHLILDEADEMLNMGFVEDMEEIMKHTNADKKTLLFSATMPDRIKQLAHKYMDGYTFLKAKKERLTTDLTDQIYFEVNERDKFEALCRIIDVEDDFYGLVFCRTKKDVDAVANHLKDRGYDAEAIHGDISQAQRQKTLDAFRKQRVTVLVATDVAARGIDVNNLTHVINYSLPQDPESYVHRIGRTGRAGREGTAVTFITSSEYKRLLFIQRIAKADIKKSKVPGVKEILEAKKKKFTEEIMNIAEEEVEDKYYDWADQLLSGEEPADMLAVVLKYCFEDTLNPEHYGEMGKSGSKGRPLDQQGKTRLFVGMGKKDKVTPKRLVELLTNRVSIDAREIGDIQVMENFSFVTVPFKKAEEIISKFRKKGKKPLFSLAKKRK